MSFCMILNIPAVLSFHEIAKEGERERGRESAGVEIPKKARAHDKAD